MNYLQRHQLPTIDIICFTSPLHYEFHFIFKTWICDLDAIEIWLGDAMKDITFWKSPHYSPYLFLLLREFIPILPIFRWVPKFLDWTIASIQNTYEHAPIIHRYYLNIFSFRCCCSRITQFRNKRQKTPSNNLFTKYEFCSIQRTVDGLQMCANYAHKCQ